MRGAEGFATSGDGDDGVSGESDARMGRQRVVIGVSMGGSNRSRSDVCKEERVEEGDGVFGQKGNMCSIYFFKHAFTFEKLRGIFLIKSHKFICLICNQTVYM